MKVPVHRSPYFEEDFSARYEWYLERAGAEIAAQFVECLEQLLEDLSVHPGLGRRRRFRHRDLAGIRSFGVPPPFRSLIVFYRFTDHEVIVERLMHGSRDLSRRLLEAPDLD